MIDYSLALMTGIDIPIPELQLTLHQPTIKEISYLGESDFFGGISCLCIDRFLLQQDKSLMETTTNFQVFMAILMSPQEIEKKAQVFNVLTLLFPGYKPMLTPRSLALIKDQEAHPFDDKNFEVLQEILKKMLCLNGGRDGQPEYNPKSKKAKEIAAKIMRGRQRVAEQKAKEKSESSFVQYLSVLTIGVGSMTLQNAIELTVYQFYDLIERYSRYINWDIDIRARLAGAKGESELDNWMENIH